MARKWREILGLLAVQRASIPSRLMAIVAMTVCCGIPLLLGVTSLAVTGVVFGSSALIIGAVALCVVAFGRARAGDGDGDDCCHDAPDGVVELDEPADRPRP